ncbi:MAG: histidine phosphotransferase family protein [Boseongicola sp.]
MKDTASGNNLSALIGSRICHDLISPLGAIGNGVELLSMSGIGSTSEIALIAESVESASSRIRFFRVAFGAAAADAMISQNEVQSILRDMYKSGRTRVDWWVEGELLRAEIKLVFLLIQCLESTLAWGGQIAIKRSGGNWHLDARGEKLKVDDDLWNMITDPSATTEVAASMVHFALVGEAAHAANRRVASFISETRLTVSF